jgi:hypothetical protein
MSTTARSSVGTAQTFRFGWVVPAIAVLRLAKQVPAEDGGLFAIELPDDEGVASP